MIDRDTARLTLDRALAGGGDFAEIYLEDTTENALSMLGGRIENAVTSRAHGAGIRVYDGTKSVYVYGCDTSRDGLIRLAGQAAEAVGATARAGSAPTAFYELAIADRHAPRVPAHTVLPGRKAQLLRAAHAAAKDFDPCIGQVSAALSDKEKEIFLFNSEGLEARDARAYTRLAVSAVASDGAENQTGFEGPGLLGGYELFEGRVDPAAAGREAARTAALMLRAENCPAGEMPVAIGPGFGGVIFHEACGHSLEATSVAVGNSEFQNRLGEKIASEIVTAIDDGTLLNAWGSSNIDDEGTPTNRLTLIEKGVLKNYMIDRLNARRMQLPVTGSARRQSYAFAPTSRMRNTFIAPGESAEEEILSTMGDGLYAKKMGGGSVNPLTGEFNFSVGEGYLIRDGKIARPVRGATLVGRGSEVLLNIDRVGRELSFAEGLCGSLSGSVPVCIGQPMIRVSRMTVGGRK